LKTLNAETVESSVVRRLQDTLVGVDAHSAIELLQAWLFLAMETRQRLSFDDLQQRVLAVGRFINERSAHHLQWFRSILPLTSTPEGVDTARLRQEFYSGVSARFEHILSQLDVRRDAPLKAIDDAFQTCRLVVVHGASGQGKTALAYRYLRDFVPEGW